MAITRAQQAKQMLQDGGMLVQPSTTGKRPGYRSARAQDVQGRTSSAVDTGDLGSESANVSANVSATTGGGRQDPMGGRKDLTAAQIRAVDPIQFGGPTKNKDLFTGGREESFLDKLKTFVPPTRKVLYNITPNNPKTELRFLSRLKNFHPTVYNTLPQNLKDLYEETEQDLETRSFKDFDKFSFDDFQDLTNFKTGLDKPGLENFAEYAAKYAGAPGLKFSGNVGGKEKFVTGKDPITGETTYGYRDKQGENGGGGISDLEARLRLLEEQKKSPTDEEKIEDSFSPNFRLLAGGGMAEKAPYEGGIMDLESARQMYGLGKLVKKVTRSVKKIAKSPLGKAAIGAALFQFGKPFLKSEGLKNFFLTDPSKGFSLSNLIGKNLTTQGALTGIAGISALSGLMVKPEEDDDEEQYAGADLPFPVDYYLSGQYAPNMRLAAEGG